MGCEVSLQRFNRRKTGHEDRIVVTTRDLPSEMLLDSGQSVDLLVRQHQVVQAERQTYLKAIVGLGIAIGVASFFSLTQLTSNSGAELTTLLVISQFVFASL